MITRQREQRLWPVMLKCLLLKPVIEFLQLRRATTTKPKMQLNRGRMIPARLTTLRIAIEISNRSLDL